METKPERILYKVNEAQHFSVLLPHEGHQPQTIGFAFDQEETIVIVMLSREQVARLGEACAFLACREAQKGELSGN